MPDDDAHSSLLAQLVARRALPPEPVATDALVHGLARSDAARVALSKLTEELCRAQFHEPLKFDGQVTAADDPGRPTSLAKIALGRV